MKVEHLIDKSEWPDGPWKGEPDRLDWVDEHTGYECMIRRGITSGALCGYVRVPYGHPCFPVDYHDAFDRVQVHGGLTFSGAWNDDAMDWWLGFDCAHHFDYAPALSMRWERMVEMDPHLGKLADPFETVGNYRDVKYVVEQCTVLAAQLKVMETIQ